MLGQTKDVGFQFGIRKTVPLSLNDAWDFMFSAKGIGIWLGSLDSELELKKAYATANGVEGIVRIFKPFSHIRMSWKKQDWSNTSTLQIRVIEKQGKSTIAIHQEKLLDAEQRKEMKAHWSAVMKALSMTIQEQS